MIRKRCGVACRTRATLGRIAPLSILVQFVRDHYVTTCTEEKVVMVLKFLAYIGTILYFSDVDALQSVVVLDPQWFGLNVIGCVLAPQKDDLRENEPKWLHVDTASVAMHEFCTMMTTDFKGSKFEKVPGKHIRQVVMILQHLLVCNVVDGSSIRSGITGQYLVFPSMLRSSGAIHNASTVWAHPQVGRKRVVLGRRLQCDDVHYLIPSGFFPKLQVRVQQLFGDKESSWDLSTLQIWYHGLYVKTNSGIEALIQHSYEGIFSRQYVDVIVWDYVEEDGHLASCKSLLDRLIGLCEMQQREHHFGRVALQCYVLLPQSLYDPLEGSLVALKRRKDAGTEAALAGKIKNM